MISGIFDSHAHYDDRQFNDDRMQAVSEQFKNGVCGIINCGSNIVSSKQSIELAGRFDNMYAAVGIHPLDVDEADLDSAEDDIKALTENKKVVAIGEIGLDYHYLPFDKERQQQFLELQLQLANKLSLPVIIHDRESHEDIYRLLKKHQPKGVIHCFSGSAELMKEAVSLGFYIGIGGSVTFKNARHPVNVAREIPLDRLLLETDCPYMSPVPYRGKRNQSLYIEKVVERIAEIRDITPSEVVTAATENTKRLFGIE